MRRAAGVLASCAAALLASLPGSAHAGAQQYEPLAASVRTSLHAAVADRASPQLVFAKADEGQRWLDEMSVRLARQVQDQRSRIDLLTTIQYEAKRAGLDPQLVLSVVEVESKFRKYAVSRAGARGYMQVMPIWVELIGARNHDLFNLRTNLRYGCVILRHYLDVERGDVARSLLRYNGSLGGSGEYAARVMSTWQRRWMWSPVDAPVAISPGALRYVGDAQ